ncbi:uncharacterized protein LOC118754674 [Rhagoletis pomonella]|nr:uncharacterized protein LOC118740754 [Rhagoletis pomonella]XP_036345456.1 uncharacterized protein LOC118754674 [Rhagoletis pomonella]
MYPDIPSSMAPVPHSSDRPVPTPPEKEQVSSCESPDSMSVEDNEGEGFNLLADNKNPYYPNQKDMNDLIRDLGLTKSDAELLTSRLMQWNLLDPSVKVTCQRKRHERYQGQYNENMMGDYIWGLIRESDSQFKRKCRKTTRF